MVDGASLTHSANDGGEVVVGQHHCCGFFRHLCSCNTHRNAHIGLLKSRGIVHAIARHCNNFSFCLELSDESHFVFWCNSGKNADVVDLFSKLFIAQLVEFRACHCTTCNAKLTANTCCSDSMIASNHFDVNTCGMSLCNSNASFGARWVNNSYKCEQSEFINEVIE